MSYMTEKRFDTSAPCFANNKGRCQILSNGSTPIKANAQNCQECRFFKTRVQYAKERLDHLDAEIIFANRKPKQVKLLRAELYKELKGDESK